MIARFYNYQGERNRLDKSSLLTLLKEEEAFYLKGIADFDDLRITVNINLAKRTEIVLSDDSEVVLADDVPITNEEFEEASFRNVNYVYLDSLKAYYFVTAREIYNVSTLILTLSIDLLMTYKSAILAKTLLCVRRETNYDISLYDGFRPTRTYYEEERIEIPINGNVTFKKDFEGTENHLIITTLHNPYFHLNWTDIDHPFRKLVTQESLENVYSDLNGEEESIDTFQVSQGAMSMQYYCISEDYATRLANILYINETKNNFIVSVVSFPFDVSIGLDTDDTSAVLAGEGEDPAIYPYREEDNSANYPDYYNPENYRIHFPYGGILPLITLSTFVFLDDYDLDYRNFEPYSQYDIYIPFYGYVAISAREAKGHTLSICYSLSTYDGSGTAYLMDKTRNVIVWSASVQVGHSIEFSKTNIQQLQNKHLQQGISLGLSYLTALLGFAGSMASGNAVGAGVSAVGAISKTAETFASMATDIPKANVNTGTPSSSVFSSYKPYIRRTRKNDTFADGTQNYQRYLHLYGRPYNRWLIVGNIVGDGFASFDVDSDQLTDINATRTELEALSTLLKNGIYV